MHGLQVQLDLPGGDAVLVKFVLGAVIQLRRFQQGFGRNTARIQTGPTKGLIAVPVQPVIHAGGLHAQLRSANGRDIAGGTTADDDDVEILAHCVTISFDLCLRFNVLNTYRRLDLK